MQAILKKYGLTDDPVAHDFIWRDENELDVLVHGFFDEPGTCTAIDLDAVAG